MEIIESLDQDTLALLFEKIQEDHDSEAIKDVLSKPYVYQVKILVSDFERLLINSSTEIKELQQNEYPSLGEVIRNIRADESFLNRSHINRGLNGTIVKKYRDAFLESGKKPENFFIVDRTDYPLMNKKGLFYVRDGMHHLVAYGLAVQMQESAFPVFGYYGKSS